MRRIFLSMTFTESMPNALVRFSSLDVYELLLSKDHDSL